MAQDLHALEIGFAKNPSLEACLPLCAAYLAAKRYMEATVVCKKGIKNAPAQDPRGRIMLAQVMLEQGKSAKAQAELTIILQDFPDNPRALALLGRAHQEQGNKTEAITALQAAYAGDNSLEEVKVLLGGLGAPVGGVTAPSEPALPAAPAPASMPQAAPQAPPPAPQAAIAPSSALTPPRPAASPAPAAPTAPAAPQPSASSASLASGSSSPEAHVPPQAPSPPKSRVDDFFAPQTLGYTNEVSDIETAGPGRLTILGFVPKNTGSLKTTLAVFVTIFVLAVGFIGYQWQHSRAQQAIGEMFAKIRTSLDEDNYPSYKQAVSLGERIFAVDAAHTLTRSAMAYAQSVLAFEHHEAGAQAKAEAHLASLAKAGLEENEFHVAARALMATLRKDMVGGLPEIRAILHQGGSSPLVELEAFRLMNATAPEDKETKVQLRRVMSSVSGQARVLSYLGFYHYGLGDNAKAAKFFEQTLQNVKAHPVAKLGQSLVALEQNVGLLDKQKDIERNIQEVLSLPAAELSAPVNALAVFTRSQLRSWQNNRPEAQSDFAAAQKLDPQNSLFDYRRGLALLRLGDFEAASVCLEKAAPAEVVEPRVLAALLTAQTKAKKFELAQKTLTRARLVGPKDVELTLLEAALQRAQGNSALATGTYGRISLADDGPDYFTRAQMGIGQTLLDATPGQAVGFYEALLAKLPEGVSAQMQSQLLCQLGQAYEATQNRAKALQSYSFGIEKNRYDADCFFFQCRLLGAAPEAKDACKTYLNLQPFGPYAAQAQAMAR